VLSSNETPALPAGDDQLAAAFVTEHRYDIALLFEINEQPDRFAVAAAARQLRRLDRVEAPVRGENQKFRRGLSKEGKFQTVAGLKRQSREVRDLAAQSANPALFRYDDRDRFALDQCLFDCRFVMSGRLRETGAPLTDRRLTAEHVANLANLFGDPLPLL